MDMRGPVVPDTSVIIEGVVSKLIAESKLTPGAIIIANASLGELEHQANAGYETGQLGLDEIRRLRIICQERDIPLEFRGKAAGEFEIAHAKDGAIDAMIRDLAQAEGATLITADRVQLSVADALGIATHYIPLQTGSGEGTALDEFFTDTAMSVHLKEDAQSVRKVGKPGEWHFEKIDRMLDRADIQAIAKSLVEQAGARKDSYIETERRGSTILQLGRFRTVIAKPPFASGWEITAVRPVKQLDLDEYKLSAKLQQRLAEKAEGVLVAGAPGSGKSTFVQALTAFYVAQDKIVKTIEAPRDLIVPKEVTQYSLSNSTPEEVRDVLLLNRPDYTVFDEMRNTDHFTLYTDLRLSGVGMIGVVHATKPIDAIQRFMSRIELGVIPHVVDTVIFIKGGAPQKVFSVEIQVKVPTGMTEDDLARPVVCISDFESERLEYEVYTFGEQTMVIPVTEQKTREQPVLKLAAQTVKEYFYQFADKPTVQMVSASKAVVMVPKDRMAAIIGTGGKNIQAIEEELGISIELRERGSSGTGARKERGKSRAYGHEDDDEDDGADYGSVEPRGGSSGGEKVHADIDIGKKDITAHVGKRYANEPVTFYDGARAITTMTVTKKGHVHISRDSQEGVAIAYAFKHGSLSVRRTR